MIIATKNNMKIDEVFEHIGSNFGKYHKVLYVIVFIGAIPNALVLLHFVFTHYEADFHCRLPAAIVNISEQNGMTYEELVNHSIPMEKNPAGNWVRSQCLMYDLNYSSISWKNSTSTKTVECRYVYHFYLEEGQTTAVADFEMVCDRSWMVPVSVSAVQAGMALGSVGGLLGDRFGRRPVFIGASAAQIASTAFAAMSWEYYSYALANFLAGCTTLVNFVIAFVLASEVIAVRWRNFISISSFFAFGLGYCVEAALALWFRRWRDFMWAITASSAIIYIPTFWFLPESARWLLIKGRTEDGEKELKKMSKLNKCDFSVDEFIKTKIKFEADDDEEEKKETTVLQTLKILILTKLRMRCLSVFLVWFVTGLSYYALSLYSTSFSDNRFMNLFLAGVSEFPALFAAYYAVKLIGRPRAAFLLMFICGSSCLMLPFITGGELSTLRTIVAMIGKGAISAIFYAAYFLSAETIPTLQRSSCISIASFCARVGGFGAPFLAYLGKTSPLTPNLLMGAALMFAAFMCIFFVPETRGVPLPDTTEEAISNKRIYHLHLCRDLSMKSGDRFGNKPVDL